MNQPDQKWPQSLLLAGAGKMGGAMLRGWLKLGMPGERITIVDPFISAEMKALGMEHGISINPAAPGSAPEVLVLAIKPQMLDEAAGDLAKFTGAGTLVISILAGKTIGDITARLAVKSVVRAMPNTPAAVGRGITGVAASTATSVAQQTQARALLGAIGGVVWLDSEDLIDAVTAVSGSGPAYVFYLVECMAKAGVSAGLPADLAMQLARATVEGSGELMFQDGATDAGQLRVNVTSPGGTTAAALDVLMADNGLAPLMERAILAAKRRAGDLSG